ncbi:MAG: NAD(P)H-dependent glycerol-3-phosphate dehydrogenase [Gemmatimonadota bacterium]|nr:NAD(P)H-dependent glycerol-3-phosphate dehydrogenase [Gemmatimonadota bacterium]
MSPRVGVLGGGSWGTALAGVLAANGNDVSIWVRRDEAAAEIAERHTNERYLPGVTLPETLAATTDLGETVRGREFVLSACPSHAVRDVLGEAAPLIDGEPVIVSASKGIEIGTDLRMTEVLRETLGEEVAPRLVVLSGPSFAHELIRGLPSAMVAASSPEAAALEVQGIFQNSFLRIYTRVDVVGTELGGALKNVIALAAGISDGLRLGSNARAALITRGLAEMRRLAIHLGADENTLSGLAGLGDLVLTCTGDSSRNRTVGLAIGRGEDPQDVIEAMEQVVEGVRTARAVQEMSEELDVEMPITQAVYSILYEGMGPRDALANLMARVPRRERD